MLFDSSGLMNTNAYSHGKHNKSNHYQKFISEVNAAKKAFVKVEVSSMNPFGTFTDSPPTTNYNFSSDDTFHA